MDLSDLRVYIGFKSLKLTHIGRNCLSSPTRLQLMNKSSSQTIPSSYATLNIYQNTLIHTNRQNIGIEPLKAIHDATKLDLTVHLLSIWCIDID